MRVARTHPLDPRRESVVDHDGSAVLVPGESLPGARVRHGAHRLVPRVLAVEGVTDGTRGLHPEQRVDAVRAERVRTLQSSFAPDSVQADGAVFRTLTRRRVRVFVWSTGHCFLLLPL